MSVKVLLRKNAPKKDGTLPVIIQVIANRKAKIISTGYAVKETQFREGLENWVYRHPDAVLINSVIEAKRSTLAHKAAQADITGKPMDDSKTVDTFFKAVTAMLQQYETREQVAAFTRLKTNLDFLKEAWGRDVKLDNLSKDWVNKYIDYRYSKGNSDSTVKKNLQDLAVVLNSLEDYKGKNYFYLESEKIKAKPVRRESLTASEIKALEKIKLQGLEDLARDMFMFSYYCHGMRFESVALLARLDIKDDHLRYRMNKGQKIREIFIHDKLQAIIDKYKGKSLFLFPLIKEVPTAWNKKNIVGTQNTMIRAYLNRVAILAGIKKHIMFHSARHTFATIGLSKGLSYSILKDALGHTNYTTTMQYLNSLTDVRINDAVKDSGMFD